MANPDLQSDTGAPSPAAETRGPGPEIVYLPDSFDLGAFPSEEPASSTATTEALQATPVADEPSAPPAVAEEASDVAPHPVLEESQPHVVEPAPVLEFSVRTSTDKPHLVESAPESIEPLTLLQVLEAGGHVSWREAVAIVQQLCVQLKDLPSQAPVLIEPGSIQIAASGQLRLLSNQQGGDPLVIQLGRLLGSMLSMESVPPELRLLVSQATFELAIFDSVDHFAQALAKLSGPPDSNCLKIAFGRAVHHVPPRVEPVFAPLPPTPVTVGRPIVPQPVQRDRKIAAQTRRFSQRARPLVRGGLTLALVTALVVTGFLLARDRMSTPRPAEFHDVRPASVGSTLAATSPAPVEVPTVSGTTGARRSIKAAEAEKAPRPPVPALALPASRPAARSAEAPTPSVSVPVPVAVPPSVTRVSPGSTATQSPADLIRRASALYSDGRASDGAIVLDLLVLTAPLYEPPMSQLAPELIATFRASQRSMLPNMAARELDKATAALDAGDIDRATSGAERAGAMLERFDVDSSSPLRARLDQLTRRVGDARSVAENTVYGRNDTDVIPPEPLSRQFPEGVPSGIPPARVGTLELIIGKTGDVEFVKLHTPLNRYHERMIVSAVKAWRYRPALKAGNPVRFRLTISVNLPESPAGTW